jgi:hypothetical protein
MPHLKMHTFLLSLSVLFLLCAGHDRKEYLIKTCNKYDETACGYVNSSGDTVIAVGTYEYCYTDTLKYMAIVLKKNGELIAIDRQGMELFEVMWYDNGPDYFADGLIRIKKNGKIGYADERGRLVIAPQFQCAFPFANGSARVALTCKTVQEGEHSRWESDDWFYIDKQGRKTVQ